MTDLFALVSVAILFKISARYFWFNLWKNFVYIDAIRNILRIYNYIYYKFSVIKNAPN